MSTWEDRMAERAAEREAARRSIEAIEIKNLRASCDPTDVGIPGHESHHLHVQGNCINCSCGHAFGCFSYAPDPRYWSDNPVEREQMAQEEADYQGWISCRYCGERGVVADDDFGVWPPRTIEA